MKIVLAVGLFGLALLSARAARADDASAAPWVWDGHWQVTVTPMVHGPFASAYSGQNSLRDETEWDASLTSTLFLGTRLAPGLELYADPELYGGDGFSDTLGVAGFPNGEIYHITDPSIHVGLARAYLQWTLSLGGAGEDVSDDQNQLAGRRAVDRFTAVAGQFSLTDFFDDNTYSHDPRNQFLNWSLMDMGAWDYAADTQGYTQGLYLEWNRALGTLRFAEVLEPTSANGPDLDDDITHNRSENSELDLRWSRETHPGAVRLVGYWNHADMGNYRETLDSPSGGMDIENSRTPGAEKYGFGLNWEQQVAKDTGLFSRVSWNDGATETWAFTEIDRSASLGAQFGGGLWGRDADRAGLAAVVNGLSPAHEEYLAAGGYGFIIGDGALDYGLEQIVEAYYDYSPVSGLSFSPDFQWVKNPAYNQSRGPVEVYGLRAHFEI